MTENKLIELTNGEKCWFWIGVLSGLILTMILLWVWVKLPEITPVEQALFGGILLGGTIVWAVQKLEWEENE